MNQSSARQNIYYQAQDVLSRRDHSEHEVRTKLKRKGFAESEINQAITWLYENKLLNDFDFARRYVENTLAVKAVGPRWLQQKLRQKGVASEITEEAIDAAFQDQSETELAQQAAEKWRRVHKFKGDLEDRADQAKHNQRLQRHLASRGFSFDAIISAIDTSI